MSFLKIFHKIGIFAFTSVLRIGHFLDLIWNSTHVPFSCSPVPITTQSPVYILCKDTDSRFASDTLHFFSSRLSSSSSDCRIMTPLFLT